MLVEKTVTVELGESRPRFFAAQSYLLKFATQFFAQKLLLINSAVVAERSKTLVQIQVAISPLQTEVQSFLGTFNIIESQT